jgi:hypothetical protein
MPLRAWQILIVREDRVIGWTFVINTNYTIAISKTKLGSLIVAEKLSH